MNIFPSARLPSSLTTNTVFLPLQDFSSTLKANPLLQVQRHEPLVFIHRPFVQVEASEHSFRSLRGDNKWKYSRFVIFITAFKLS